jgi:hypothetical protein
MPTPQPHTEQRRWTAIDLVGLVEPIEIEDVRGWADARHAAADRLGIPIERVEVTRLDALS